MRDAVIVEAVRTPTGKRNGGLAGVQPSNRLSCGPTVAPFGPQA